MRTLNITICSIIVALSCSIQYAQADFDAGFAAHQAKNYEKALEEYEHELALDNPKAKYALATMYFMGDGVKQDSKKAVDLLLDLAKQDQNTATAFLEIMSFSKKPMDSKASLAIGAAYERGAPLPKDYVKAFTWYKKSAEEGNPDAMFSLGLMYEQGRGVTINKSQAASYYLTAAILGLPEAQTNVGILYLEGNGLPQSDASAFDYFSQAADKFEPMGINNLAYMFENGRSVQKNRTIAYALYKTALSKRHDEITYNNAERIKKELNEKQIKQASQITDQILKSNKLTSTINSNISKTASLESNKTKNENTEKNDSPYPEKPNKVSGSITCNTQCYNSECYRTYDTGKKVKFRAKNKYNPVSGQWEWGPGSC
ncbi:tetratricopeptide repeat protein [Chitinilyticum aquatile]|uniref:tetratricopeptide repeat protein n=1 Tax=Chitinilyticum aquatile TaxID=362520 RepID=UPI00042116B8|nr:tetratricopeptide repeat protein [Chitinilyticum aquatile]